MKVASFVEQCKEQVLFRKILVSESKCFLFLYTFMKKRNFASSLKHAEDLQLALWKCVAADFCSSLGISMCTQEKDLIENTSERQNVVQRKL